MKRINFKTLQKKKWYKYLKYTYLTAFVVSFALILNDSLSILRPTINVENSYIQCDNGQRYQLGDYGMYIEKGTGLRDVDDRTAKKLCVDDATIGELARATVLNIPDADLTNEALGAKIKEGSSFIYQNIYLLVAPTDVNYQLVEVYKKHSALTIIGWLLLPILLLVIIFELELRIFYYLVLGKFLPERPSRYLFFKVRH